MFLSLVSSAKDLSSLGEHVQVHLGEERNVEEHDEPEEIEVGECPIPAIWHLHGPNSMASGIVLCPVEAEQFSSDTNGIESDESSVPEPGDNLRHILHEIQGIIAIADNLCH